MNDQPAPEHHRDECLAIDGRERPVVDPTAIPEDGDGVTESVDLIEAMGDIDDAHGLGAQELDDPEEPLDLPRLEDEVGVQMITTRCCSFMARATATVCWIPMLELVERTPDVDLHAVAAQGRAGIGVHLPVVDEPHVVGSWPRKRFFAALICGTRLISW